jgi:hypothetical protein
MTLLERRKLVHRLKRRGFDKTWSSEKYGVTVRCSQCEALVINGIACHETGCPNNRKGSVR